MGPLLILALLAAVALLALIVMEYVKSRRMMYWYHEFLAQGYSPVTAWTLAKIKTRS